jgi:SPP1 family predicted phage head-tail adaptor
MVQTAAADAIGQPLDTWIELRKAWADIRHPRGLEAIGGDKVGSEVKASIRVRYCTDVTAGMRVHHGSAVYHVDAALPDETGRQWTDIVCKQVL